MIRAQPDRDFLRLEAVVRSDAPVAGQYSFVIAKQSSTGSSNNTQSGTFALQNAPEQVLTTVILDRSAIGHYRAELSLQSDLGRFTCTSP
ncbi:curli-like amyloid fiber formation chaperone CsgH [Bradyrhizobium sp. dw_78]|uniref:curli-like amyloid fiber formation chaperone CsgH n=1 Tax=Bradyrhizobium sp. dw_78 TaxID=2719793 RepID=UPI001BD4BE5C